MGPSRGTLRAVNRLMEEAVEGSILAVDGNVKATVKVDIEGAAEEAIEGSLRGY